MRAQPKYQLPKKSQTVWRLYGIIQTVILALIAATVVFFAVKYEWPQWIIWAVVGIVVLSVTLSIIIFPNVRWKIWRYEVREQEIEIRSGSIVKRTLIPMVRVQHVDTEQGPILKNYNLANISISSAATVHTIPMLLTEDTGHAKNQNI